MKQAEVREAAKALFNEHRNPFGAFSLGSETHHTATIPDAVRRCRWIAVDLNAKDFMLFFVGPATDRTMAVPCFDSTYPDTAPQSALLAGENGLDIAKHARRSTVPCWWNDGPECPSSLAMAALGWCDHRAEPVLAGSCGIAFPVQGDHGQCGLVIFTGEDMTIDEHALFDIHARCFALFDAVSRIRSGVGGRHPSMSRRELECLKLTANGYTSEEIARLLKLSVHTANQYLTNTAQKLDAVNRVQAVAKALRLGLIE